ncbi:MAG: DUF1700 domain-containing protein [Oscillospiraceae bacterium]|jgi:uncharacterized membrane protein|nr:DUF1700 domain-containing protein [Oscillospiraceae bacterium]
MTQQEFMSQLRGALAALPEEKVREIEDDISRHFEEGRENGEPEDDIAVRLGDPAALAKEYLGDGDADMADSPLPAVKKRGFLTKFWIAVGMGFFTLVFVFPFWITLVSLWIVPACGVIFILSGVLVFVMLLINATFPNVTWIAVDYPMVSFFAAISIISLGGLFCIAAKYYGQFLIFTTKKYLQFFYNTVNGRDA